MALSQPSHSENSTALEQAHHLRLLEAALAAIDAGMLLVDGEGRLVFANPAAQELAMRLRWPDLQAGEPLVEPPWHSPEGRPVPPGETPLARALQGEDPLDLQLLVAEQDGGEATVRCRARPIRDGEGRIVGAVVTLDDVRQRVESEAEARELDGTLRLANERLIANALAAQRAAEREQAARAEAEEAVRARDEFLVAAAHELKTPVTSLRGYAQLALRRLARDPAPDPEQLRRALTVIDRQAERLARLVSQLLDTSLMEGEGIRLFRRETDVAGLVCDVVAAAQENGGRHSYVVQAPAPAPALVDPQRLEQVLQNLLDNARKHSPPDAPVEIQVSTPEPETVRIAVRDHGPGLPPQERARLFERFHQAHRGAPHAGLGLGLYVSRHIVELHGGQILAEFPDEGGSRFIVSLPRGSGPP